MPTLMDFKFDNLSRIGNDESVYTQDNMMNTEASKYMTFNPFENKCLGGSEFAMKQTNVFVNKSTYGVGPLGCNVNEGSILSKGILTNDNVKLTLRERPYLTVPFLGRGNAEVSKENKLRMGDTFKDKKSVVQMNEQCFNNLNKYPMNEGMKNKIKGAKNGWETNGVDTRNIYKSDKYSQKM